MPGNCHWLPKEQQRLFTLGPMRLVDPASVEAMRLAKAAVSPRGWLLVAAWEGEGRVARVSGTASDVARQAARLAERTGDTVLVGEQVGLAGDQPVFKAVGRVLTEKDDPLSTRAFDAWTQRLSRQLQRTADRGNSQMAIAALEELDFDFLLATGERLEGAVEAVAGVIEGGPGVGTIRAQQVHISRSIQTILRRTTGAVVRLPEMRGRLGTGFRLPERHISRMMAQHHGFFVRDQYGRVSQTLSAQARGIIRQGVERGLDRRAIARQLGEQMRGGLQMRGYWQTVAANHVATARSYGHGGSYRAAGITHYRIEAVLDDRTTHQCEFLHLKVLPVEPGMRRLDAGIADPNPEGILWSRPFMVDHGDHLSVDYPDGSSRRIADISQRSTGAGPGGGTAQFANPVSPADLVDAGVGFPPYHHGCRTVTVAM
jgi:hypothetical protein